MIGETADALAALVMKPALTEPLKVELILGRP
jgi:hypothetical protein